LKEGGENCVDVTQDSDTWPEITETKEEERRGQSFPKISLRC